MRRTFGICLFFFLLANTACAQHGYGEEITNARFTHVTVSDGLSHHETLFVMQDSLGFMWFGTKHGLNKYDGINVIPYFHDPDSEHSNSLTGNFAHWIHEDQDGALWIATWGDGLSRYDPKYGEFTNFRHEENNPQSLGSNNVWSLYVDRKGFVWAATDCGLSKFNPVTGVFIRYRHNPRNPNSLSHNTVSRVCEDDRGILWISTYGGGLNRFDPETGMFTSYKLSKGTPQSLSNNNLWSVYIDSRSRIWIGSEKGLNRFDPETETFISYQHDETDPNSLSSDTVTFIYEDHAGMLWLGTFGGGLNRFDPEREKFIRYRHDPQNPDSLSNDIIMSVYEDTTGTLWVATYSGVDKFDPGENQFKHYRNDLNNPNDLSEAKVRSIYCDKDKKGTVWIGTGGGGLNRLDEASNRYVYYLHDGDDPTSISDNDVWAISQDERGDLWVGTHGAGLNRFNTDQGTFIRYEHAPDNSNTLAYGPVYDLVVDQQRNVLWIASYLSGLDKFDITGETFTHYRYDAGNPDGIVSNWSTAVFVDSKGFVWVGTEAGLSRFNPETEHFANFKHNIDDPRSLSSNMIQAIFGDSRGIVWIGTSSGLNKYEEGTHSFERYSEKDGLAGNRVAAITEDNDGHLWISTDKGLSKLNSQNDTFRNYDQRDGLQSDRFLMHSAHRNEAGELFFGGTNGFNAFHPSELTDNQHIPKIVFTDFQLFNQPVTVGEGSPLMQHINQSPQILLKHDEHVFSIEFVALNYRNSRKNQYAYMMEGFDKDFTYKDSNNRSVTYTNLSPGYYTFHVRGSNNDGVWNKEGASIKITILSPWWETVWFKALIGVLIFFIILGVVNYVIKLHSEIKQRKKVQNELKESEEKYRHLIESQTDLFCRFLPDGRISFVNDVYCQFFNKPMEELIGFKWQPLPVDDDVQYIEEKLSKLSPTNQTVSIENRVLSGEGEIHWIQFINKGFFDRDGKLTEIQSVGRDITDRKQAEMALRQSEKDLRASQQIAHLGSWRLDVATNQVIWTEELYKMYGFDPALSPPPYTEHMKLFTPESWERLSTSLEKTRETGTPYELELETVREDGSNGWMWVRGEAIKDSEGNTIGLWGAAQDITARKQVEEALQKSNFLLSSIIESPKNIIILSLDRDYRYTAFNEAHAKEMKKVWGVNIELGKKILDYIPGDEDREKAERNYERVIKGESLFQTEEYGEPENRFSYELTYNPITDEKNNVVGLTLFIIDVTDRKQAEWALRESEEQYRAVADNISDYIMRYDKEGRHIYANRAALEVTGLPVEEYIGKTHREMGFPEHLCELLEKNIKLVFDTGGQQNIVFEVELTEGPVSLELQLSPEFAADGSVESVIGISRDVTERKKMEVRLQQAQKMESIGNLAGGIAHDFNNILFPIVGMAEMLMEDLHTDSLEYQNAHEVLKAGKRGSDLVKQILAFSRQTEHQMMPIRIQQVLSEVLKLGRSTIPSNIEIVQDIQKDCGLAMADPTQVHQIAMNLITNAYHAVEQAGGKISVQLREIRFGRNDLAGSSIEPGPYASLSISDTGCGIDPVVRDKIFDPYFTTKEQGKGTGLGLAVVYGIVREHSGDLKVFSELGKGSTFTVYLPLLEKPSEIPSVEKVKSDLSGDERILLVDDEEAIVRLERQMLMRLGYRVTSRTSSVDALDVFRANPLAFDLVISDMTMPNMTGDKLAHELNAIRPDIPVIICTGFSERIDKERAASSGIKGFLMKPIVKSELGKMVRKVLGIRDIPNI